MLSIVITIVFYACSKDASNNVSIAGKWSKSSTGYLQQYEFKGDMTYQLNAYATDPSTSAVLGYQYKSLGKYKLEGDKLTLSGIKSFYNASGYGPETSLTETGSPGSEIYTVKITNNKLELHFTCPPNANCVASPIIYTKM